MSQFCKSNFSLQLSSGIINRDFFHSQRSWSTQLYVCLATAHRRCFLPLPQVYASDQASTYIDLGAFLFKLPFSSSLCGLNNLNMVFQLLLLDCRTDHHWGTMWKSISYVFIQVPLLAEVFGIEGNIFRLKINEETPLKPRYEVPDVLTSKPNTVR